MYPLPRPNLLAERVRSRRAITGCAVLGLLLALTLPDVASAVGRRPLEDSVGLSIQAHVLSLGYGDMRNLQPNTRMANATPESVNPAISVSYAILDGFLVPRVGVFIAPKAYGGEMDMMLGMIEVGACAKLQRRGKMTLALCLDGGAGYLSLANPTAEIMATSANPQPQQLETRAAEMALVIRPSIEWSIPIGGGSHVLIALEHVRSLTCVRTGELTSGGWCPKGMGLSAGAAF